MPEVHAAIVLVPSPPVPAAMVFVPYVPVPTATGHHSAPVPVLNALLKHSSNVLATFFFPVPEGSSLQHVQTRQLWSPIDSGKSATMPSAAPVPRHVDMLLLNAKKAVHLDLTILISGTAFDHVNVPVCGSALSLMTDHGLQMQAPLHAPLRELPVAPFLSYDPITFPQPSLPSY
jgi:hypothetical protein